MLAWRVSLSTGLMAYHNQSTVRESNAQNVQEFCLLPNFLVWSAVKIHQSFVHARARAKNYRFTDTSYSCCVSSAGVSNCDCNIQDLINVTNGIYEVTTSDSGCWASYQCNSGYTGQDIHITSGKDIEIMCTNGRWSGEPPMCEGIIHNKLKCNWHIKSIRIFLFKLIVFFISSGHNKWT